MELEIIAIYCWAELIVNMMRIEDDCRTIMTTAEVITTAIVAGRFFFGNFETARKFLKDHGYIPDMLSKSRLNRRLHSLGAELLQDISKMIGEIFKSTNTTQEYAVDSFPVAVCENCRIFNSKIYHNEKYRGYQASKKRYFYGVKVHMIVTVDGLPIEFILTPGSCADVRAFKGLDLDLPEGATIYADKAYTDYEEEDFLKSLGINLLPQRKENAKKQFSGCLNFIINQNRKMVETTFGGIAKLFPKHIHAINSAGFELKVALFSCVPAFCLAAKMLGN